MAQDRTVEEDQDAFASVMANDAHPERGLIYPVFDECLGLSYFNRWSPSYGLYELWYPNGRPQTRWNYKDGLLDGLYETWYENGQLCMRANFKQGEPDEVYETWTENGQDWLLANGFELL